MILHSSERARIFHRLRREKSPANFYLLLFKRDTLEPSLFPGSSLPVSFYSPFLDAFYFLILDNFFVLASKQTGTLPPYFFTRSSSLNDPYMDRVIMLDKLEGKLSYMVNLILNIIKIFTDSSFIYDRKEKWPKNIWINVWELEFVHSFIAWILILLFCE